MKCAAYSDILYLPYTGVKTRRPMPPEDRAAQFAPFAALTGFDAILHETARRTDSVPERSEEEEAQLNEALHAVSEQLSQKPAVKLRLFVPDSRKPGGAVVTVRGRLRRIDTVYRTLTFTDARVVALDNLLSLEPEEGEEAAGFAPKNC